MNTRRRFLKQSATACAGMMAAPFVRANTDSRPNIVFIYVDDYGWNDVSYNGSQYFKTPNIDRLASEGITFTNAYANAPNCAPSRACLMTGQYSPRHGIYTVGSAERGQSRNRKLVPVENKTTLPDDAYTLADWLSEQGYACAHVGKWHLGDDPTAHGFQYNVGGNRFGHPGSYFAPYRNIDLGNPPDGEFLTDRLTNEAIHIIEENKSNPFFLYFSHYSVHTPLQAKQETIEKYKKRFGDQHHNNPVYAAMIEHLDDSVGKILDTLDRLGLRENTLVVFSADNGGYGPATSMYPLRGSKGMMYEGGIRVPQAVRWPKRIAAGSRCDVPVIGTDWFPTFAHVAGASIPDDVSLDGENLTPLFDGKQSLSREAIYWHFPAYLERYATTDGWWRTTPVSAIRKGRYKLHQYFEDNSVELYDLEENIGESNNLAGTNPELVQELLLDLQRWQKNTNAFIPTERNPDYDPLPFTG